MGESAPRIQVVPVDEASIEPQQDRSSTAYTVDLCATGTNERTGRSFSRHRTFTVSVGD